MQRLSKSLVATLKGVDKHGYDRADLQNGIVHIGLGGFHRAHQAYYTEQVLNSGDLRWGIKGASLQSTRSKDALSPQDFLYTLSTRDTDQESLALQGGLLDIVTDADALQAAIANPTVKLVTLTITEKGYVEGEGVAAILAHAIKARMQLDAPLTIVSCDNLTANGRVLRGCVESVCDAEVLSWMQDHVSFPSSMVDRITPQTTEADVERITQLAGYQDASPVVCEPFCQWIIEDDFRSDRPEWEAGGAMFVTDVAPYEQAKLRMLNASHSMFAYLGLLKGYEYVHEAAVDQTLSQFVLDALDQEVIPNIDVPKAMNAGEYVQSIMQRFRNSAVPYRTAQVASDGSLKLPQRIYPTAQTIWTSGQQAPRLELALCAWLKTLRDPSISYPDPGAEDIRSVKDDEFDRVRNTLWKSFPVDALNRLERRYLELSVEELV